MNDESFPLRREQLLTKERFIDFCNDDKASSHTSRRLKIDERFLDAAKKDGLIVPILTEKTPERLKEYFSPHQILMALQLRNNFIDENGYLHEESRREYYKKEKVRYVAWGMHSAFWARQEVQKDLTGVADNPQSFSVHFHSFLSLLHRLPTLPAYEDHDKYGRMFNGAPELNYDFTQIGDQGTKLLKKFGLSLKKLQIIARETARVAAETDPLELWHYFTERIPRYKRDQLKGEAALAQDIYDIFSLAERMLQALGHRPAGALFEYLHTDITPFLIPRVEYLGGVDSNALLLAIQNFHTWRKEKGNSVFVSKEALKEIARVEEDLKKFHEVFGKRRYTNYRTVEPEEVDYSMLYGESKHYADILHAQAPSEPLEEIIPGAIDHHLRALQRELFGAFYDGVGKKIRETESAEWAKERNIHPALTMDKEKFEKLSQEEVVKLYRAEGEKVRKNALKLKNKGVEFSQRVSRFTRLALCTSCERNPIQLHREDHSGNAWENAQAALCDECLSKPELRTQKGLSPWKCESCGNILVWFSSQNIVSETLRNTARATFTVEYGKARIEVKCPNARCGQINGKVIEWGWLP